MDPALFDLNAEIEQSHWWFVGRREIMRAVLDESGLPSGGLVVDVGCGTGANVASLADRYRCVGIDPTPAAIEHAQRRFPDVAFVAGQAPDDVASDLARADAVLLMDVLEHVEDDRALLAGVVELLRPGAHVLVTVPADMRLWTEHDVSHGHYRRYDVPELRSVWEGLPVSVRLVSSYNTRLYPIVRTVRAINKRRGRAGGEEGSDLDLPMRPINAGLRRVFSGERRRLTRAIDDRRRGYRRGVSLIALLQRSSDA